MTNTTPGTSPVAPSQNPDVKAPTSTGPTPVAPVTLPSSTPSAVGMPPTGMPVPSSVPPVQPAPPAPVTLASPMGSATGPSVSMNASPSSDLPAVSLPTTPGGKPEVAPESTEKEPEKKIEDKVLDVPTPMAKPLTPPVANAPVPPVVPPPLGAMPSPVTPPPVEKTSLGSDSVKPLAVPPANLVSPVTGAVPTTTVKVPSDAGSPSSDSNNKPKKAGGSKLKFIAPLLLFFFLVFGGGVAFFLSQRQQNIQNQASSLTSKGAVEQISCGQITGWACDSANYAQSLKIAVYYDEFKESNLLIVADANVNRASAAEQCGGTTNHGFVIDIPSDRIPAGDHQLIVKGIPVGAGNQLNTADMFNFTMPGGGSGSSATVSCGSVSQSCSMTFTAQAAPENSIACVKESFADELSNTSGQYTYNTRQTSFEPGEIVVFRVTMRNTGQQVQQFRLSDVLTGENLEQLDFVDTSCGSYDESTRTITANTNPVTGGDQIICGFRARVKSTVTTALVITNTANITSGDLSASCNAPITISIPSVSPSPSPSPSVSPTPTPSPSPSPLPSPSPSPSPFSLSCGSSCTDTSQCAFNHSCENGKCVLNICTAGASCSDDLCRAISCGSSCSTNTDCPTDHTCSSGVCKLTTCVEGSSTCTSDSCSVINVVTVTQTPPPVAQPSPAVGCNQSCQTNADCSDGNHICVDTSSGRRCRLDSNVASESCSPAGQAVVPTPMPQSLPVAGSNDILKAVGVGAAAVILGIVGLLLL